MSFGTRTCPEQVTRDPGTRWIRLEVIESVDDTVEFRAHFKGPGGTGVLYERSRFAQRAGRARLSFRDARRGSPSTQG